MRVSFEYVYQAVSPEVVTDRSIHRLVAATVEGVNASVLSFGSSATPHGNFTQGNVAAGQLGLAGASIELLFEQLADKHAELGSSSSPSHHAPPSQGRHSASSFTYYIKMSYLEFYDNRIKDLLAPPSASSSQHHLHISQSPALGVHVAKASWSGPLQHIGEAVDTLARGRRNQTSGENAHGTQVFSATLLTFQVLQQSVTNPQLNTVSCFSLVDFPSTERLSRSLTSCRLAEGPTLNKTLHATDAVLQALSGNQLHRDGTSSFPPYRDSHLTTLLTHQLGGNCLTCAIIFFTENDPQGSKASLELGQRLAAMVNYPVINNEMVQGLTRRVNGELEFLREALAVKESTQVSTVAAADPNLVKRVHELEGMRIQENLHNLRLKEEKEQIMRTVSDFRVKYQLLVTGKTEMAKQLIETEEAKLKVSKALLDVQLENTGLMEKAEQDKFDIVTKLLNAENDILELEMREEKKVTVSKVMAEALEEALVEKKELAMEFVSLKTNYLNLNASHAAEITKNATLGQTLLTLSNQRKVLTVHNTDLKTRGDALVATQQELRTRLKSLEEDAERVEQTLLQQQHTCETLRKEKAQTEWALQSATLAFDSKTLAQETQWQALVADHAKDLAALTKTSELEVQRCQNLLKAQTTQTTSLSGQLRQEIRKGSARDTIVTRYKEDSAELLNANTRLEAQCASQQESYRAKLLRYYDLNNTEDAASTTNIAAVGHQESISAALMTNFKEKEQELVTTTSKRRTANQTLLQKNRLLYDAFKKVRYVLEDHLSAQFLPTDLPPENELVGTRSAMDSESSTAELTHSQLTQLQGELRNAQEANLTLAEETKILVGPLKKHNSDLMNQVASLINERDHLSNQLERLTNEAETGQENGDASSSPQAKLALEKMQEMQESLLEKIQQLSDASEARANQVAAQATKKKSKSDAKEKLQKSPRLSLAQRSTTPPLPVSGSNQSSEGSERRCAELLTKYTMATQELETFKAYMTQSTLKLKKRIKSLEAKLAAGGPH